MVGRAYFAASLALAAVVVGCGVGRKFEPRASWRGDAEDRCLASGAIRASRYVQKGPKVGGIACGIDHPLKVSGLLDGRVAVTPAATINCPLTAALNRWVRTSVQPAAYRYLGEPVVGIRQIASYGCRGRNGSHFGPLSEHSFGNALDVTAFRLASGREISVAKGWSRGSPWERAFLQAAFAGACVQFYTVLGPGSDRHHYDHFHLDLLRTNARGGRHYCRPAPGRYDTPTAALPTGRRGESLEMPFFFVGRAQE